MNAAIPFYHRLAELIRSARTLPRSEQLPRLAHIVDEAVQKALATDEATSSILMAAQEAAARIRL